MSHTISTPSNFDVNAWLETAKVLANVEVNDSKAVPCPPWLTLSKGTMCKQNAFAISAGVIKASRQIIDAITFTARQLEEATERLHMQEQRNCRTTIGGPGKPSFGPEISKLGVTLAFQKAAVESVGFNPDGVEFQEALLDATAEVEKLEAVLENGKRIIGEVLQWIIDNASPLELKVEVGHTVKLGPIGNEIRTARYALLTPDTLQIGIDKQREFLRNQIK